MYKKRIALAVSALLVLSMFPAVAFAVDTVTIDLSATLSNGTGYTIAGNTVSLTGGVDYILTGNPAKYKVAATVDCNITLSGMSIDTTGSIEGSALDVAGGKTVNLTLVGSNTLTGKDFSAGLHVPERQRL